MKYILPFLILFLCSTAQAQLKYIMADETTGQVWFDGISTNAGNTDMAITNIYLGLNLQNTNVVNSLSQLSRASMNGYGLDCTNAAILNLAPGQCADSEDLVLLEIVNPTNLTFAHLDVGVEAADTWYFVYVALTNDVVVPVLSTNQFTPVGYDAWRRVGSVYNDASSDFYQFDQVGQGRSRTYTFKGNRVDYQALNAGTSGMETLVDLSAFVPPTVEIAFLGIDFRADNGAASDVGQIRHATDDVWLEFSLGTKNIDYGKFTTRVVVDGDQFVYYQVTQGNKNDLSIFVTGFQEGL